MPAPPALFHEVVDFTCGDATKKLSGRVLEARQNSQKCADGRFRRRCHRENTELAEELGRGMERYFFVAIVSDVCGSERVRTMICLPVFARTIEVLHVTQVPGRVLGVIITELTGICSEYTFVRSASIDLRVSGKKRVFVLFFLPERRAPYPTCR